MVGSLDMDTEPRGVTGVTEHGVDVDRGPRVIEDGGDGGPAADAGGFTGTGESRRGDEARVVRVGRPIVGRG